MRMKVWATGVAVLALAVAAASAFAAPRETEESPSAAHTPRQLEEALSRTAPHDPAIARSMIAGCRELAAKGLESAACAAVMPKVDAAVGGRS